MRSTRDRQQGNAFVVVLCSIISIWALANSNITEFLALTRASALKLIQGQNRVIMLARSHVKDPLEITEVRVKDKAVRVKEDFVGDADWLKQTTFKIRNKYQQPITYVQIDIDFPETATTGIMMQHQILLGRHPDSKIPSTPPLQILPGESLEVSLAPRYDRIKRMIESRNPSIEYTTKIVIRLSDVAFEDGTLYAGGRTFQRNPDPKDSRKWLPINR